MERAALSGPGSQLRSPAQKPDGAPMPIVVKDGNLQSGDVVIVKDLGPGVTTVADEAAQAFFFKLSTKQAGSA